MANDVFANGREIACKKADGKSICAFPDVCMTPPENPATPAGVPVPYPNTGYAKDTTKGSKTVKISGQEVMLKNKSYFKQSTGDEAGSATKKGVATGVNKGKVYFNSWSMNVKIEGKNVVRHLDLTTHNHGSLPGNSPPIHYTASIYREDEDSIYCCSDIPTPIVPTACDKPGNDIAGCDYYQKRHDDFVARHSCCEPPVEPPDYYLNYGMKYCRKFTTDTYHKLSPKGQAWLQRTRCELQKRIEYELSRFPEVELDSETFREMAFDTHPKAYYNAGISDLPPPDLLEIVKVPELSEWGKWDTWEQAIDTGGKVILDWVDDGLRWVDDQVDAVEERIRKLFE